MKRGGARTGHDMHAQRAHISPSGNNKDHTLIMRSHPCRHSPVLSADYKRLSHGYGVDSATGGGKATGGKAKGTR